jgi:Cu(I)/Ag(I) efflux system membrane fusion protein
MNVNYVRFAVLTSVVALLGVAGGYWWGQQGLPMNKAQTASEAPSGGDHKVLYWYDPMYPQQHFDKPGKSPFMDMALLPKYAEEGDAATVKIDPAVTQNLGIRVVTVKSGPLATAVEAVGMVGFNERDVAVVQARSGGFVERVYAHAPGDMVTVGSPLVDLLMPEWTAAQTEFLALRAHADPGLLEAAQQRLRLSGMPQALIERVERMGSPQPVVTITTPITGVIQQLDIRAGMTVVAGQTLARINGLATVWLEVAVPEARAGALRVGQGASARFAAFPGEVLPGRVSAILPEANPDSRTLKVRVELPNRQQRLKPGLTAQVRLVESASTQNVLRIPTEAVIRTGKRALTILAEPGGHYRPVEVSLGPEINGDTVIRQGLAQGQQVVSSGQFLIDSEARLRGTTTAKQDTSEQIDPSGGER